MKDINISEIISRKELPILNENDSLNTYLYMAKQQTNDHYILNNQNILTGIINENVVLQFISPMLLLLDQQKGKHFMNELKNIPVSRIANKDFTTLDLDDKLSDILVLFAQTSEKTLPVVDKNGKFTGNVSVENVLNRLTFNSTYSDLFRENILQAI